MPADTPPTSKDVAAAAGVSQSTVSMVLSGKWPGRVSERTAQKVRAAAERLGYRPNPAARNLRLGRTRTIMLVIPTITAPFFASVHLGAARVAAEHGFSLVVFTWPLEPGGPFDGPQEAIDGMLASSMAEATLAGMRRPVPLVMLDSDPAGTAPTVNFDIDGAMRDLTGHLADLGHHRIGHVAADIDVWTFQCRAAALAARVPDVVTERAAISFTTGFEAATRLLTRHDRPTALVCDDDTLAVGAYKAARALGLDVPGDVAITGFDDMLLAEALELTTVRLPAEQLGARAMLGLLDLLNGRTPPRPVLPAELVIRRSTSPSAPLTTDGHTEPAARTAS
ncbi:LacI family DNA-binding transcriptional regulator [Actinocorallia libanotica]|uniref:LacI family DNA-binding transcriptional regulator n=1 Tax=Actinocorallia libanotica TaxID=46162 RepID=A0ABN1RVU3_9ACTN